jgi:hypothetical protein
MENMKVVVVSTASQKADSRLLQHAFSRSFLNCLFRALPENEIGLVTAGKHLLHSTFLRQLAALASDIGLDYLLSLPSCSKVLHKLTPQQTLASSWHTALSRRGSLPLVVFGAPRGGGTHRALPTARRVGARVQSEAAPLAAQRRQRVCVALAGALVLCALLVARLEPVAAANEQRGSGAGVTGSGS